MKTERQKQTNLRKKPKQDQFNSFFKYSNLAIQLVITIGLLGFIGYKIDEWLGLKFPAFLILFITIALIGIIYKLIKNINAED